MTLFVTEADRQNEKRVLHRLQEAFGGTDVYPWSFVIGDATAPADGVFGNNDRRYMVEIKTRHRGSDEFADVFLEENKYRQLVRSATFFRCIPVFAVWWTRDNMLGAFILPELPMESYPRQRGGRTDRGLAEDIDNMILLPISKASFLVPMEAA